MQSHFPEVVPFLHSKAEMSYWKPIACLSLIAACTPLDTDPVSPVALFKTQPDNLYSAFEQSCTQPASEFVRVSDSHLQCRIFMSPDATAAAILQYDGHLAALPYVAMDMRSEPLENGVRVEIEYYLNVPQKSGPPVHVKTRKPRSSRMVERLLTAEGGRLLSH